MSGLLGRRVGAMDWARMDVDDGRNGVSCLLGRKVGAIGLVWLGLAAVSRELGWMVVMD